MRTVKELRREFEFTLSSLLESVSVSVDDASSELKVRHKGTGFQYTVISISKKNVLLKNPEGKEFSVDAATFEKSYEV